MKFTRFHMFIIGAIAVVLGSSAMGFVLMRAGGFRGSMGSEGFQLIRVGGGREGWETFTEVKGDSESSGSCNRCKKFKCKCPKQPPPAPIAPCPRTVEPDLSKYILKSQVPSTSALMPDMSNYMLKTECPPVPDLSKYVLKSSIPKPQPVIVDNSSCKSGGDNAGECPPCPRPRCPTVKCPAPVKCPPPAPCPRPVCPPTVVKCKSEESTQSTVRPFLAPLNMQAFGMA
jgi:hypothetical protein